MKLYALNLLYSHSKIYRAGLAPTGTSITSVIVINRSKARFSTTLLHGKLEISWCYKVRSSKGYRHVILMDFDGNDAPTYDKDLSSIPPLHAVLCLWADGRVETNPCH